MYIFLNLKYLNWHPFVVRLLITLTNKLGPWKVQYMACKDIEKSCTCVQGWPNRLINTIYTEILQNCFPRNGYLLTFCNKSFLKKEEKTLYNTTFININLLMTIILKKILLSKYKVCFWNIEFHFVVSPLLNKFNCITLIHHIGYSKMNWLILKSNYN